MNITIHIERLVLEGVPMDNGQRGALQAAIEDELVKQLATAEFAPGLLAGGALAYVRGGDMPLARDMQPPQLGQHIAQAILLIFPLAKGMFLDAQPLKT
jgi:hypothetical protein